MDKIETLSIYELFSDKNIQYIVPKFQRDFVWDIDQIDDLWELILQSYENPSYLGSIVLSPEIELKNNNCRKYSIIDGQQRLLTIYLLLIVCKNLYIDNNQAIKLIETNCKNVALKIIPRKVDDLSNVINNKGKKNSKFHLIYGILKLKIEQLDRQKSTNLFSVIVNNIKITTMVVSQNDSESYLFEVLNEKGTSLTPQEIDSAKNRSNTTFSLEESEFIEFKEGAVYNPHTKKEDKNMIKKVLIAVASFMNSKEGGTIYIGIEDKNRIIRGINREYKYANSGKNNWDGYELFLADSIENKLTSPILFHFYKIKKEVFNKIDLCKIEIKPSTHPVFMNNDFHVKTNSRKKKLIASEMAEYILTRWSEFYVKQKNNKIVDQSVKNVVPTSLAKPNLNIKQTGFSSGGHQRKNEYTFNLNNRGGDLYNTYILVNDVAEPLINDIARGKSQNFKLTFVPPSPEIIRFNISGHDANGEEVRIFFLGALRKSGYVFENYN